jgi:hypothetical protein
MKEKIRTQTDKLIGLLLEGRPVRTDEIVNEVYGDQLSLARVAARVFDAKKLGHVIVGRHDKENPKLYWYAMNSFPAGFQEKKPV